MKEKENEQGGLFKAVYIVGALCAAAFVLLLVCIAVTSGPRFSPPPFEESAQEGLPTVPEGLGWEELWQEGMEFKAAVCGVVIVRDGVAEVNFANTSDAAWLRLRVFDEEGNLLGETGLLKEHTYVPSVQLTTPVEDGQKISMKVMAYQPETYQSLGAINMNTALTVEK